MSTQPILADTTQSQSTPKIFTTYLNTLKSELLNDMGRCNVGIIDKLYKDALIIATAIDKKNSENRSDLVSYVTSVSDNPLLKDEYYIPISSLISNLALIDYNTLFKCMRDKTPTSNLIAQGCKILSNFDSAYAQQYVPRINLLNTLVNKYSPQIKEIFKIIDKLESALNTTCVTQIKSSPTIKLIQTLAKLTPNYEVSSCPKCPVCNVSECASTTPYKIALGVIIPILCIIIFILVAYAIYRH
jgi:hypothetical protein